MNSSSLWGRCIDLFFCRVSYAYHGLAVLFQRTADWTAVADRDAWGTGVFRPGDEARIKQVYTAQSREGALQPKIVVEVTSSLTPMEARIQNVAFRHHRDLGTLKWRYLSGKIASELEKLKDENFRIVSLVSIAAHHTEELYTDYCHLTSAGSLLVAGRLYSEIVKSLDGTR